MTHIKSFTIGAISLNGQACSVAFNFYQAGQLNQCMVIANFHDNQSKKIRRRKMLELIETKTPN